MYKKREVIHVQNTTIFYVEFLLCFPSQGFSTGLTFPVLNPILTIFKFKVDNKAFTVVARTFTLYTVKKLLPYELGGFKMI